MADQNDPRSLEMRLSKLEDAIGKLAETRKSADISAEEMKTYMKVRDSLDPEFCGPNDCMRLCIPPVTCFRCLRCIRCIRCINECNCGPGTGGGLSGGFSDIGF
ncbi:MAG TPA: hypothetical protein VGW39_13730 [Chthoniobacterales bacterium]|nr:hypothetical protein [Chthoniobacterales bacterium]